MAIYGGIILQLRTDEGIFVSQADSASCQVMITIDVTRGVADGDD